MPDASRLGTLGHFYMVLAFVCHNIELSFVRFGCQLMCKLEKDTDNINQPRVHLSLYNHDCPALVLSIS